MTEPGLTEIRLSGALERAEKSSGRLYHISRQDADDQPGGIPMKRAGRTGIGSYSHQPVRALGPRRRHHEVRPYASSHPSRNAVWGVIFAVAATLGATDHSLAQEPIAPPPVSIAYPVASPPHRWCDFLLPNDGIPRTYSYYYSPWLNQPRLFRVRRPNGSTYWTSTPCVVSPSPINGSRNSRMVGPPRCGRGRD